MIERKQDLIPVFPVSLDRQDRLFLEMAVVDEDSEEAGRLIEEYGVEIPDGLTPLILCKDWISWIKKAEQHHCQNMLDLHSQGRSIGGMQALVTSIKREV